MMCEVFKTPSLKIQAGERELQGANCACPSSERFPCEFAPARCRDLFSIDDYLEGKIG